MNELLLESHDGLHVGQAVFVLHPTESWVRGTIEKIKRIPMKNGFTEVVFAATVLPCDTLPGLSAADAAGGASAVLQPLRLSEIHPIVDAAGGNTSRGTTDPAGPTAWETFDDLLDLSYLHDSTLLEQVRQRYFSSLIYTHIGPIVLALNPYDYSLVSYTDDNMPTYIAEGAAVISQRSALLPHAWTTAHYSYWLLSTDNKNQCVIVSGESGAGKTETAKIVTKYLGRVSTAECTSAEKADAEAITLKVNLTSPILEAFGNAKTKMNDNSSRFGKFMKVHFRHSVGGAIMIGASMEVYLLEKSRIVSHAAGERSYHSFYQLLAKAGLEKAALLERLQLTSADQYHSTSAGRATVIPGVNDGDDFDGVVAAMGVVGISPQEQSGVWGIVAAVLHLLAVEITATSEDACCIALDTEAARAHVEALRKLLGLASDSGFFDELVTTTQVTRGETIVRHLRREQSIDLRDAMAKTLYEALFLWLVSRINSLIAPLADSSMWIGLLDIFGFENFTSNSFEQLCINLANEALQNHYNSIVFTRDMEECREEGINTEGVVFYDNQPCLDLICGVDFSRCGPAGSARTTNKMSLMALLDEECALGKGSDISFCDKARQVYGGNPSDGSGAHPNFISPKTVRGAFVVRHYAGDVRYTVDGFRGKNLDTTKETLKDAIRASTIPFVASLLPRRAEAGRGTPAMSPVAESRAATVGTFFRNQLVRLMTEINGTHPHWIRCVKPHSAKRPRMFCGAEVMAQMRSAGVLETVRIRQQSFSIRQPQVDFIAAHRLLLAAVPATFLALGPAPGSDPLRQPASFLTRFEAKDVKECTEEILERCGLRSNDKAQVGKSKVFMKSEPYHVVSGQTRALRAVFALGIQAFVRERAARTRTEAQRYLWYIKVVSMSLWERRAQRQMRHRELRQKETNLLTVLRDVLLTQSEEMRTRENLCQAEYDAFGSISAREADGREVIHEKWKAAQRAYCAARQAELMEAESAVRTSIELEGHIEGDCVAQLFVFLVKEEQAREEIELEEAMDRRGRVNPAALALGQVLQEWRAEIVAREQLKISGVEQLLRAALVDQEAAHYGILSGMHCLLLVEDHQRRETENDERSQLRNIMRQKNGEWEKLQEAWWRLCHLMHRRDLLTLQRQEKKCRQEIEAMADSLLVELVEWASDHEATARQLERQRVDVEEAERRRLELEELERQREEEQAQLEGVRCVAQQLWRVAKEEERLVTAVRVAEEELHAVRRAQAAQTRRYMDLCRYLEVEKRKGGAVSKSSSDLRAMDAYRREQQALSVALRHWEQELALAQSHAAEFLSDLEARGMPSMVGPARRTEPAEELRGSAGPTPPRTSRSSAAEAGTVGEPTNVGRRGGSAFFHLSAGHRDVSVGNLRSVAAHEGSTFDIIHRLNVVRGTVKHFGRGDGSGSRRPNTSAPQPLDGLAPSKSEAPTVAPPAGDLVAGIRDRDASPGRYCDAPHVPTRAPRSSAMAQRGALHTAPNVSRVWGDNSRSEDQAGGRPARAARGGALHRERNPFKTSWAPGKPDANGVFRVFLPNGEQVSLVPSERVGRHTDQPSGHVMDSDELHFSRSPDPYIPRFL